MSLTAVSKKRHSKDGQRPELFVPQGLLASLSCFLPCAIDCHVSSPVLPSALSLTLKTKQLTDCYGHQLVWQDEARRLSRHAKKQNNAYSGREQIIDGKNDEMARGVAIHPTGPPFAAYLQQMGRSIRRRRPRCIACAQRACPAVDDEYSKLLGMTRASSQTPRSLAGG